MKIETILIGSIGEKYGDRHYFHIDRPIEIFYAMAVNYPTFQSDIKDVEFCLIAGGVIVSQEDLNHEIKCKTIFLMPIPQGSGTFGKIFGGIVLAVAGFSLGLAPLGFIGLALAGSGLSSLLSPKPKKPTTPTSVIQATNSDQEGGIVPLCYGRGLVGSQLISQSIDVAQQF